MILAQRANRPLNKQQMSIFTNKFTKIHNNRLFFFKDKITEHSVNFCFWVIIQHIQRYLYNIYLFLVFQQQLSISRS
jgi:hypothetical protein